MNARPAAVATGSPTRPDTAGRLFVAGAGAGHEAHLAAYGPAPSSGTDLIRELELSGLTGRGGAAFPVWRKLAATAAGRRPVVIGNGAEGEPRSRKDATLVQHAPHLVVDGLLAAADAVRASRVYLYVRSGSGTPIRRALAERPDGGRVRVVVAPHTFVSGEAGAVVNAVGQGVALPTDRLHRLSETGLDGRPTLVHNVETLAHLGLVARYGGSWFRGAGTLEDPGTRLVTVSGDLPAGGVLEIPGGTRVADVLAACGTGPVAAVLVGGYHGAWLPAAEVDARLSPSGRAVPGAGVLIALGPGRCGLHLTAQIVRYLAGQSAGQCGPCRFGLPALAGAVGELAGRPAVGTEGRVRRLATTVAGRGACHHPDGTSRLVLSALDAFADDVAAHATGRCVAGGRP
ncbi:NADH-ubiquinone oxidoreductase-F iron-sulfur binding region domain-containing protein [Jiangella endophytica]|uniref:NADH-ubiquinone oxidoreductase-F iron-sulfur binding region domain-containing protein n=1 Tax=Jiangella endophytica TaxID=1623398 RepID=UPI000E348C26|nr:NADH-ubiquinone oxidoreductase-F iron-sulfur binding region domain-containing protein [Jiangella endophytica]